MCPASVGHVTISHVGCEASAAQSRNCPCSKEQGMAMFLAPLDPITVGHETRVAKQTS